MFASPLRSYLFQIPPTLALGHPRDLLPSYMETYRWLVQIAHIAPLCTLSDMKYLDIISPALALDHRFINAVARGLPKLVRLAPRVLLACRSINQAEVTPPCEILPRPSSETCRPLSLYRQCHNRRRTFIRRPRGARSWRLQCVSH
ncbi:hypothetical protein HGRIS_006096 [Hohenbuehelia grisea]|uniref:Uncharacterized protein n=1 Tax=Hohenbuehelia grisea TaxID=104357 RepID=A0ABR3JZ51_9AGAR